jgi:hypothetical protein
MFSEAKRDEDGTFPAWAWPGGYPLYYLDNENNILCPKCANKEDMSTEPLFVEVNYEDTELYCDDCSQRIVCAYLEDVFAEGEEPS